MNKIVHGQAWGVVLGKNILAIYQKRRLARFHVRYNKRLGFLGSRVAKLTCLETPRPTGRTRGGA